VKKLALIIVISLMVAVPTQAQWRSPPVYRRPGHSFSRYGHPYQHHHFPGLPPAISRLPAPAAPSIPRSRYLRPLPFHRRLPPGGQPRLLRGGIRLPGLRGLPPQGDGHYPPGRGGPGHQGAHFSGKLFPGPANRHYYPYPHYYPYGHYYAYRYPYPYWGYPYPFWPFYLFWGYPYPWEYPYPWRYPYPYWSGSF
jgi:hypothetical protein